MLFALLRILLFSISSIIIIINWGFHSADIGAMVVIWKEIVKAVGFFFFFFSVCLGFRSRLLNFDFAGPVAEEHSSDLFCTLLCLLDVHSEILDKDCKDFSPTFL